MNLTRSPSSQGQSQPLSPEFLTTISLNTSTPSQYNQSQPSQQPNDPPTSLVSYGILRRCWRYERGCSLLLPYPQQFLETIQSYIKDMEDKLSLEEMEDIPQSLHELEIERIRYIYNDFHRIRLRKIEKTPLYYAYDRVGKEKLSIHELEFAKAYTKLFMGMMKHGLEGLPGKYSFETVQYETPQTDEAAMMHYIPENPQVTEFEIPNQKYNLFPNTLIVAPYEECNDWIQRGEFDVL